VEAKDYSARFLINISYLIIITTGVLADFIWKSTGVTFRYAMGLTLCLFLLTSLSSNWSHIFNKTLTFKDTGVSDTIAFLRENGLNYGYGPYWGANANAVTVASSSEVCIRPVVFNKNNGRIVFGNRRQSSKRWYTKEDPPAGVSEFFVIVKSDGEECPDVNICLNGLVKRFGQPLRTIKRADSTILVWDHSLTGYEAPPILAQRNYTYFFNEFAEAPNGKGWSLPEQWGTWTEGNSAFVRFNMSNFKNSDVEMVIDAQAYLEKKNTSQIATVFGNGHFIGKMSFSVDKNSGVRLMKIPRDVINQGNGVLIIEFLIDKPVSPREMGISTDSRKLGLGLTSLSFR
jgi:hypothetical protein